MSLILKTFLENEGAIKRLLARFFPRKQDVEDLAQETFLRAYAAEAAREADEFADVIVMRLSEALELIQRGEIVDGKTALGILYAAGFKTG